MPDCPRARPGGGRPPTRPTAVPPARRHITDDDRCQQAKQYCPIMRASNIINTMSMVLSSWPKQLQEFTRFIWWVLTLHQVATIPRPSQSTWTVSPPTGWHHSHRCHQLLLLLSRKADTHFTIPQRLEGWVGLGIAVWVYSLCARLYVTLAVDHCDLHIDTWVWTTCLRLLLMCGSRRWTCDHWVASPTP